MINKTYSNTYIHAIKQSEHFTGPNLRGLYSNGQKILWKMSLMAKEL